MVDKTKKVGSDVKPVKLKGLSPDQVKSTIAGMKLFEAYLEADEETQKIMRKLPIFKGKAKGGEVKKLKGGGLAEATAKLKAKGFSEGGAVTKDKTVAMDKSPNSGLITTKGFGASRRT